MKRRALLASIPAILIHLDLSEETSENGVSDGAEETGVWLNDEGKIVQAAGLTDEDIKACQEQVDELCTNAGYNVFSNYRIRFLSGDDVDLYDGDEYVDSITDRIHYLPDAGPAEIDQAQSAWEAANLDRSQQVA